MGMNLRYSPLEYDESTRSFNFDNTTIINAAVNSLLSTTGNVFYVSSIAADKGLDLEGSQGRTKDKPLKTLDYAIGRCTANNDDVIALLPGHTENVASAGAIACDVAGITIVGLGHGGDKATFTWTGTASSIDITGASTRIYNIRGVAGIDSITEAFNVQAADCVLDLEWQDGSASIEAITVILGNASADRLKVNLDYSGFIAGNACDAPIQLNGSTGGEINVNFYGKAATAVVEFVTAAVDDINVTGYFYVSGTTNLSKNVVDTATGSTWSVQGFDGAAGEEFSGGSGSAVASADVGALTTAVGVIDGYHDVATANAVTNTVMSDVIGNKTDAAAAGAVSETESLVAYAKQNVTLAIARDTAIATIDGYHDVATADAVTNAVMSDVVGNKEDAAATGAVSTTESLMAYAKQNVTEGIARDVTIDAMYDGSEKCISGSTAVMVNADTIFTIAGGPIKILDLVSLCIDGCDATASTCQYSADPTVGAPITFSGASASLANFAAGSSIVLNQTALSTAPDLSVVTVCLGPVSTRGIIVNEGIITVVIGVGSTTGTFKHFLRYVPLGPGVTVTAA